MATCACLCSVNGHYGICQVTANPDRTHGARGFAVPSNAAVCEPCYQAVRERMFRRPLQPIRTAPHARRSRHAQRAGARRD